MDIQELKRITPAPRKGELCVWITPPGSGRAKRVRLGLSWCALSASAIFVCVVLVGFSFGDYARYQFQRVTNYLRIRTVTLERTNLRQINEELKGQFGPNSEFAARGLSPVQGLKARLDELSSVVGAMKSFGVVGPEDRPSAAKLPVVAQKGQVDNNAEGIGGAEIECEGNPGNCVEIGLSPSALDVQDVGLGEDMVLEPLPVSAGMYDRSAKVSPALLEKLDDYIELLKTIPFSQPTLGNVSSNFGFRRSPFSGSVSLHEGIDFSVPSGSHILATGDGVVREVRRNKTYGLVIDIEHSPTITTRYAHLSKIFVKEGERICRGEILGLTGSTGRSTGPHLHYEVRVNGQPRNPARLLALGERLAAMWQ